MIRQRFTLDGHPILTMYHNKFEDYPRERHLHIVHPEWTALHFEEYWLDDMGIVPPHDEVIRGFLAMHHRKNPYQHRCCNYEEYISFQNSGVDNDILKSKETFFKVADFVQEWSGFNLRKNPLTLCNTLIFDPTPLELRLHQNDQTVKVDYIKAPREDVSVIVKFRLIDVVVDVVRKQGLCDLFDTTQEWNTFDIEFYHGKDLIYADYDVHFIQSVQINIGFVSRSIPSKLTKTNRNVVLQHVHHQTTNAGQPHTIPILDYLIDEQVTAQNLEDTRLFAFLRTNAYNDALNIVERIVDKVRSDELWVFDPYFADVDHAKGKLGDIVKILAKQLQAKKHVVFQSDRVDINKFEHSIRDAVQLVTTYKQPLNIEFFATKVHFHDRFIFIRRKNAVEGYLLGTSLHSFGDNYSAIIELEAHQAQEVFNTLCTDVANTSAIIERRQF